MDYYEDNENGNENRMKKEEKDKKVREEWKCKRRGTKEGEARSAKGNCKSFEMEVKENAEWGSVGERVKECEAEQENLIGRSREVLFSYS